MNKDFFDRINYKGKLSSISEKICEDFAIGNFKSNDLIPVGYEDFNFILKTTRNNYVVKVFSSLRTDSDCERIVGIMAEAIKNKISIPGLIKSKRGYLYKTKINNANLRLCVMKHISGKDFYSLKHKVDAKEIKFLARQASLINSLKIKPKFIYDSWAITNFIKEFNKKGRYLIKEDLKIVKPLVKEFGDMKIQKLPHCFVHGDIISPNVIKDKKGKIWIIDFSVSNYYPRIQELAVLGCGIFFDEDNKTKSEKNLVIALKEYQKKIKLTEDELRFLPAYIKLAHAMHILLANYQKIIKKNNSEENDYFLRIGKKGLRQMLQNK